MQCINPKIILEWPQLWQKLQFQIKTPLKELTAAQRQALAQDLWIPLEPLPVQAQRGMFYAFQDKLESSLSWETSTHYFEPTPPLLAKYLFEKISLKPSQTFIDLGAGIAQVNLIAALIQPKLKNNMAIDIFGEGLEHGRQFLERTQFPYPIKLIKGDIFKNLKLFKEGDVFYHYVGFWGSGIRRLVSYWFEDAKPQAQFILVDDFEREQDLKRMLGLHIEIVPNNKFFSRKNHVAFVLTKK